MSQVLGEKLLLSCTMTWRLHLTADVRLVILEWLICKQQQCICITQPASGHGAVRPVSIAVNYPSSIHACIPSSICTVNSGQDHEGSTLRPFEQCNPPIILLSDGFLSSLLSFYYYYHLVCFDICLPEEDGCKWHSGFVPVHKIIWLFPHVNNRLAQIFTFLQKKKTQKLNAALCFALKVHELKVWEPLILPSDLEVKTRNLCE